MKRLSNKHKLLFIILIILSVVLIGCSKNNNNINDLINGEGFSNSDYMERIRVWTDNAHEKQLRLRQIDRFNNTIGKEKGIEIEYTVFGSDYQEVIKAAAQNGTAPELFRPTTTLIMDFVNSGYMIPISELPGGDDIISEYDDSLMVNRNVFDGKVYSLPYNLNSYKFIINNNIFDMAGIDEYPKTWEEVRVAARKITEAGNGRVFGWGLGLQSQWMVSTYLIRANGANVGHVGFDHVNMRFDFEAFTPAIESVKGMIDDGSVFPGYEGLDADSLRAQFAEERIGMMPAASFDIGGYNDHFPVKFDWTVIPVPAFDDSGSPYKEITDPISLLGIGTAARGKEEKTMEVFKFFYSDENAAEMYESSIYIPFREEVIELAEKEPTKKGFTEFATIPDSVPMLPLPDIRLSLDGIEYRQKIGEIFAGAYEDQSVRSVLVDLDNHYNTALEKLPKEIRNEYKHSQEVMDNFIK